MKIPLGRRKKASAFRGGSFPSETTHPCTPEAVKKLKTGGDWEGEAPAEPHRARTCWGDGSPGGSPSQFFHSFPQRRIIFVLLGAHFHALWRRAGHGGLVCYTYGYRGA